MDYNDLKIDPWIWSFIGFFVHLDHGTPPPAPAPVGIGAPPEFPPRGSSFNHPALQQQRAATLVVTKDNDEPPTYEVIPYSTGRWPSAVLFIPPPQKNLPPLFERERVASWGLLTCTKKLHITSGMIVR